MTGQCGQTEWIDNIQCLLDDPLTRLIMGSDGVTSEDILELMAKIRGPVLRRRTSSPSQN